jgi:hypothetical protein
MRPEADGDQRSQWRGNAAADQDTVGQLGKHNPPRPAIPESETRSIAVGTERRLASRSVASADPTARGHRPCVGVFALSAWQDGLQTTKTSGSTAPLTMRGMPDVCGNADPETG